MRIRRSTANIAATQLYAFLYVQLLMALFHPPVAVPASSSGDVETSMEVTTNER